MVKHSFTGASSSDRWFECPGSVALCKKAPPQKQSPYAAQGTAAHWVFEKTFNPDSKKIPADFIGETAPNGYVLLEEDCEAVAEGVALAREELRDDDYEIWQEVSFDLSHLHPGLYGTADLVLVGRSLKVLKVFDYKHGAGVPVEVEENRQGSYYSVGAIDAADKKYKGDLVKMFGWGGAFDKVVIGIIQPRARHKDGPLRMWHFGQNHIDRFVPELVERAKATDAQDAPLSPGEHCRFCPAMSICPAISKASAEMVKTDFDAIPPSLPEVSALPVDKLVKILKFKPILQDWLDALHAHAQGLLEAGEEVPGFKLVKKRSNRAWLSEDDAAKELGLVLTEDDMFERKFKSPAQMEKALGSKSKGLVSSLVHQPDTGVTMAAEHDKREAVQLSQLSDFKPINQTDERI